MRAVKVKDKLNVLANLSLFERLDFAAPAVFDQAPLLEVRVHEVGNLSGRLVGLDRKMADIYRVIQASVPSVTESCFVFVCLVRPNEMAIMNRHFLMAQYSIDII